MPALRENHTAVITRNESWTGAVASEPYECGWASEAIVFLRALELSGPAPTAQARVQISPDGIRWVDEGTVIALPARADAVTFGKVRHFGNWLRVAADLPPGTTIRALVAINLKA
jgi:hypothetical protein